MVGKKKPGPKPRQRAEGVKSMMLPLECSNEEMEALLAMLESKVGTNNNRKRFEWLNILISERVAAARTGDSAED